MTATCQMGETQSKECLANSSTGLYFLSLTRASTYLSGECKSVVLLWYLSYNHTGGQSSHDYYINQNKFLKE